MFLVLFAFAVGLAVGAWLGRREGRKEGAAAAAAAASVSFPPPSVPATMPAPTPTPPPPPPPPGAVAAAPSPPAPPPPATPVVGTASVIGPLPPTPNKRALKAGLTPEDFRPKDDILLRMQEAWERGETLEPEAGGGPEVPPALEDKVQRVLARLAGADPGEGDQAMPEEPAPASAPTAGTLTEGVAELAAMGYGDDLRWAGGELTCRHCGESHRSDDAHVEQVRRYEGQSDPADEAILLGLRCPHCGALGAIVSTYGPDADPELAQAFTYLARQARHS